ncbi:MAG: ABC transporter substrate-binding protein [Hyphomicrobiaceae bacterium]|nr:ABC transporter substrate-binding protein [Hyphomicrobiaceae bacterium]
MSTLDRRAFLAVLGGAALGASATPAEAGVKIAIAQYGQFMSGFPWLVALKQGFIKGEGLDIEGFISSKGGGTSVRNILASGTPFGEVASGAAIAAIKQGVPLKVIYAATNDAGEIAWMTLPGKPISSIKDLVGKTIGYTSAKSTTEMLLRMSLSAAGIAPDQVKLVATGGLGGGLSLLAAGGIDAAPIVEPTMSKAGSKYKLVFRAADYVKQLNFAFGVTTEVYGKKEPERLRKMVLARRKAVDWIYANPSAAVPLCGEFLSIDKDLAGKVLPKFIGWKYWSRGDFTKDGLENNVRGLQLMKAVEGSVDWNKYVDQSFLPADLRRTL